MPRGGSSAQKGRGTQQPLRSWMPQSQAENRTVVADAFKSGAPSRPVQSSMEIMQNDLSKIMLLLF